MDRSIVYTASLPRTVDFLNANKFAMIGHAYAMKGCLGFTGSAPPPPYVEGLSCTPTTPTADLNVHVNIGSVYNVDPVDATAYSDLGTDSTHNILKQGILYDAVTLAITPPSNPGYSQVYLVQAALQDTDSGSAVLPYYNAANPAQPFSGPNNSGTSQNTTRLTKCAVALKAGVAAPTGSQAPPTPDVGYAPCWYVTVSNGQTQITGANIAQAPSAPFFPTLPSIPVHIQNGDWISADDTGTTNSLVMTPLPAITGLLKYQKFRFKIKNTNTGPATLSVSGFTGSLYLAGQSPSAFPASTLLANTFSEAICDGINFEVVATQVTINNNSYTTGGPTAGLVNVQAFPASGTYLPTSGATKALIFATGGGGSGSDVCGGGAGGGAGATAIALLSLSGVSSVVVTIGAGGASVGTSTTGIVTLNGNAGGTTSFGSYAVAGGGQGGIAVSSTSANGGLGGTATTGLVLIPGGDGTAGGQAWASNTAEGGVGGASFWGGGGGGNTGSAGVVAANPARAYGAGGAGAFDDASGAGKSGFVFVMEF